MAKKIWGTRRHQEKDCFFVGYLKFLCPFLFWNGFIYPGKWIMFSSFFWWCHFMASKAKIFNFGFQAWKLRPTKQTSLEVSQPSCSRKQLKKLGMFILFLPASSKQIWNFYILSTDGTFQKLLFNTGRKFKKYKFY